MKFIGLTGIIIAHVGSPDWAMMLRSFDVPFMVILSSILGERSYKKYEGKGILSDKNYFVSRVKRLVIPVWIFLTLYFLLSLLMGEYRDIKYYIASYCLTRYGIGYVWIILIYLYSALLIPVFNRLKLSVKGVAIVTIAYCLYELAYYFQLGTDNKLLDTTVFYIIPYGLLTYLGYHFYQMSKRTRLFIAVCSLLVFAALGIYYWISMGAPQLVQIAKYPPRLYYLGYGIAWSFFLLLVCESRALKIYDNQLIRYISTHSMWIYLWHILALTAYSALKLPQIWYVKFVVVYAAALLIVLAVNKILDFIEKHKKLKALKYLRG